jgi:hypothetical protein
MTIVLVLAVASVSVIVFLAGYRLAMHHYRTDFGAVLELMQGDGTPNPIFNALDREWAYTEELNKPFTNDK